MEAKQATLHHELIAQLLDSRIPKTERENALIDGFECPDWSHKTIVEVLEKYT